MNGLVVLGVFAHPDDEMCATGTLMNHADNGDEVHLLFLTQGEGTSKLDGSADQIKSKRRQQASEVAQIIGAEVHFLDIADTFVVPTKENAEKVAKALKSIKPDIIITWNRPIRTGTGHPDHRNTNILVIDAITYARFNTTGTEIEPHRKRVSLYTTEHYETKAEDLIFVDVSHQYERMMAVIQIYQETFGDYNAQNHKESMMQYFGLYSRVQYAEAFKKHTWREPLQLLF